MIDSARILDLLGKRKPHHTLPQDFYTDADIFAYDMEAIFHRTWLMVGFVVELPEPGSWFALTIGRSPIVLLRNRANEIVGFHNSCRHRGAQICADGHGKAQRLVCPYHQWTYDLQGALLGATRMGADFDREPLALTPVRVEVVAGCIYVSLHDDAPDFAPFRRALAPMLAPHRLLDAKLAASSTITEHANWKLVMENGRECHHCAACHPELKIPFPISSADSLDLNATRLFATYSDRIRAAGLDVGPDNGPWWQIGRFPFNEGVMSFSMDGQPLVKRPMADVNGGDVGTLRWATEPANFCHAAGDNVFMFLALPVGPTETRVTAKWLVHKDAVEGADYDLDRLTHVWTQTNLQDKALAENNQRGVSGAGYVPGPYSPDAEEYVNMFTDWYCGRIAGYASR